MSSGRVYVNQSVLKAKMNNALFSKAVYDAQSFPFYEEDFCQVLDSHLTYLRENGNTTVRVVDNKYMGAFLGDFYAILSNMQIDPRYHRIIMLLNGLTNPINYDGQLKQIFIPDLTLIDVIFSVYNTGKHKLKLDIPGQ